MLPDRAGWAARALMIVISVAPALGQSVAVSPTSVAFGNQALGTPSAVQRVTLKNGQTSAVTISAISTTLTDYTQTNNCPSSPATLAAGKSCTISVTFTPAALGPRNGSLTVADNGKNSPQIVGLTGTGITAVTATPASISFGNVVVGLKTTASTVTIKNNETLALTINSITTSLADYTTTTTCPIKTKTLAAGGSCTVSVSFDPTALGTRAGTLTISDNASNSPTVALTGAGVLAATTTPTSLSFGSQALGTTSSPQSVVLTNNQSSSLTITSVTSSSGDFIPTTCPTTLAAGASCTVSVTFSPTATGARTGALNFKDSANNSPQTVPLSGTGSPPNLISIALSPISASIAVGNTQQFAATGTYSDSSTQNLTNSVTWSSTSSSVASVSSGGLAAGKTAGATTISATLGSIAGSASLVVTPPALVRISVSPANVSVPLGTTQQFAATGTYTDGSTQNLTTSVTWTSSVANVASINSSGLASPVETGQTTITAASGSVNGIATLTVGAPALVSLAITPSNPAFALGTSQALKATGTYTDGSTLDVTQSVSWSSGNPAVATVSTQGVASSVALGNTSVTATSGTVSGTTTLTVSPAVLTSIAVTPAVPAIPLGTTKQFMATGTFSDSSTQDVTATVTWSSDTPATASISNNSGSQGLATSVSTGTATITASSGSVQGSTTLTVTTAALVSIAVTPASPAIALGTTQAFTATGSYTDGSTQDLTATARWSSDTRTTATINNTGLASSVNQGTSTISASSGAVTGATTLTVTVAALVSITVTPSTVVAPLGTAQQFTAVGTYTDGSTQDVTQSGHWSSTNAAAATISNTSGSQGLASTLGTGASTIAITVGTISGTATLTVNPAALVSIALSPQSPTIALGTGQQYTATGTYTDGSTQDLTGTAQWSSSSATVAVINATGLATSAGTGTATITAMQGTVTASTTITVGAATIVSLAVSPSTATIPLGTGQHFQAIATYTDGSTQDLSSSVAWSSSLTGVAIVNSAGATNTISVGQTTIAAASGPISAGAILTVAPAVPVQLSLTPSSASIAFGTQQQFQAFLTYSDGTVQNVTTLLTWTSSATGVAAVNNAGLATAVAAGSTSIFASASGGLGAGSTLTVAPPALISIAITPASLALNLSQSQQFIATGTYADSSQQNLLGSVNWNSSNTSVLQINNSGVGVAMGFGSSTVSATSGSVTGTTSLNVPSAATVPSSFFNMTINKTTTPWPTDAFYGQRLLGTGTLWGNLETAEGVYNWATLDKFVANAKTHGVDLVYTFLGVPQWASSNPSDTTCTSWSGSCDPPNDLNADGTGTDLHWINFVKAIAGRETGIKYWELWNEPNVLGYANKKTWSTAQWIRMAADARPLILSANPNAVILSPGIAQGTSWLTSFLAAGGGNYVDIIAFHGYANPPESVLPLITAVQSAATAGNAGSLPLWDTEASWGLDTLLPDLDMQAASVARLHLLQAANGVARFYWYGWDFSQRGTLWQPNTATGCTSPNNGGDICPAGIAYAQTSSWMTGAVLSGCSSAGTIWICTLARPGGYYAQVMWDSSQTCSNGVCQTTSYTAPPQFIKYRDLNGNTFSLTGSTAVPLGAKPIILENQ